MSKIVGRFAPSPTGLLHLGGARTALFTWLYSKSLGGDCLLRLEDTDAERSEQKYTDSIINSFKWMGIEFDQEPVYQSRNKDNHLDKAQELVNKGKAYYCDCSPERLKKIREEQQKKREKPKYDGKCRELGLEKGPNTVIRFKNPESGSVTFKDLVRGQMEVANKELDDLILVRSDGSPTYNLCVVVDDLDMNVSHVVRGDDHINNTFRQINIFKALEESVPIYGHVPMILGEDGKRMSKRHGAVNVLDYKDLGVLPEAFLNYIVRLGWSYGDQEMFELKELIQIFKDGKLNNSPASFSYEKLLWFNREYFLKMENKTLLELLVPTSKQFKQDDYSAKVINLIKERCSLLSEFENEGSYFYDDSVVVDSKDASKVFTEQAVTILKFLVEGFKALTNWQVEDIKSLFNEVMEKNEVGMASVGKPLRLAITGRMNSASVDETSLVLGQEKVIKRVEDVIKSYS
ncbi:MAG: glutamate--tRNA ligase [Gammaproteobacteria bacterium]|nr:MAG: glutamate--tRNA ligase [Gammaproteobacteria bacterium]